MKRIGYVCAALAAALVFLASGRPVQGSHLASRAAIDDPQAPSSALTGAFTYQGMLSISGAPYNGACDFQFGLWNAASGGSLLAAVSHTLTVSDGLFTDTLDFGAGNFSGSQRWLDVQARCPTGIGSYAPLGRQELTAAPYSLYAISAGSIPWSGVSSRPAGLDDGDNDALGGLSCSAGQVPKWSGTAWACAADAGGPLWKNMKTVALSGAEFTSIQAAIDAISGAAANNPYLVLVGPGVYTETVTLKPFVHLIGAGQDVTVIRAKGDSLAIGGVVNMASDTSLRSLTAWNYGHQAGLLFVGVSVRNANHVLLQDVFARADGSGGSKAGIYLTGSGGSAAKLVHTNALAENDDQNVGLLLDPSSTTEVIDGRFDASGGQADVGISASGPNSSLKIDHAAVSGVYGSLTNAGLKLNNGVTASLFGGRYAALDGDSTIAIDISGSDLTADSIHAEAAAGYTTSTGLKAVSAPLANLLVLRDATILARKGATVHGLDAAGVDLLCEGNVIKADLGADSTIGALVSSSRAGLKGDRVDAYSDSGTEVVAIRSELNLSAKEVIAAAEGAPALLNVTGLHSILGSTSELLGGTYSAISGENTDGIYAQGLLNAREVVAMGSEGGMVTGLKCEGATCKLWGGTFAATAAINAAHGIFLLNSPFDGSDFNAAASTSPTTYGLFVVAPLNPPVNIHSAVLEGQTNTVFLPPTGLPVVNIGSSRLVGAPVFPPAPPDILCTLTSRGGLTVLNQGTCP